MTGAQVNPSATVNSSASASTGAIAAKARAVPLGAGSSSPEELPSSVAAVPDPEGPPAPGGPAPAGPQGAGERDREGARAPAERGAAGQRRGGDVPEGRVVAVVARTEGALAGALQGTGHGGALAAHRVLHEQGQVD